MKYSVVRDELLLTGYGIYCYLPFERLDSHKKAVFKIGLTNNYVNRTEQYHTYFPLGIYLVGFLHNPFGNLHTIEKFILNKIVSYGGKRIKASTRIKETEWVYTDLDSIRKSFRDAYEQYHGELKLYHLNNINKIANDNEKKKPNYKAEIIYYV